MSYLDDIRAALLHRCPAILQEWFGTGKGHTSGPRFLIGNLAGDAGDSLSVNMTKGYWKDFATGESGLDLISLYAKIKGLPYKRAEAAPGQELAPNILAKQLGIEKPKTPKGNWTPIFPVPEDAYFCGPDGSPQLPDIPWTAGHTLWWAYLDIEARLLNFRVRFPKPDGDKEVKPLCYCRDSLSGKCQWMGRDLPVPRPLYGLLDIASTGNRMLICEGEKATDAARALLPDWTVVTWPGGCQNVHNADWKPLQALPATCRIVLWPDKDPQGEHAMSDVRDILQRPVEIIRVDPQWPEHADLYDLREWGWTTERVEKYITENCLPSVAEEPIPRPDINVGGKDFRKQAEAVFRAISEIKSDIYTTDVGPARVIHGVYGQHELRHLNPEKFAAWANWNLNLFVYNGEGPKSVGMSEVLAKTCVFNAEGQLRPLRRVADIPIYTAQGELIETSGYHAPSQTYISIPNGYRSEMGEEEAWELIGDLLADFPFETEGDKAAAIAFVITAILRDRIEGPTPMFAFSAVKGGTGKSLLCKVLTTIITPHPVDYALSEFNEENEKTILGLLRDRVAVAIFDNAEKIGGIAIKRALTGSFFGGRILATNDTPSFPVTNLWAVTVNNPIFDREIFDRTLRVRLNAHMENPRLRDISSFRHPDLFYYVQKNRGALASAFVALARSANGYTPENLPRMGTYEQFVRWVWPVVELSGFGDFTASREQDRLESLDTREEGNLEFVEEWKKMYGKRRVSLSELCQIAQGISSLDLKRSPKDGSISKNSIGWWIKKNRGNIFADATINIGKSNEGRYAYLTGGFEDTSNFRLPEQETMTGF